MKKLAIGIILAMALAAAWHLRPVYAILADENLDAAGHRSLIHASPDDLVMFWVDKTHLPYFSVSQVYRLAWADTEVLLSLQTIVAGRIRPDEYKLGFRVLQFKGADSLPVDWYRLKRVETNLEPSVSAASSQTE